MQLDFNDPTKKLYETGLDRGVFYLADFPTGQPHDANVWFGLTSVNESPAGAEPTDLYASNEIYLTLISPETFGFTIEAYTYPERFALCDGSYEAVPGFEVSMQPRHSFGLTYRTKIGSDAGGSELGYKIHLIYNAKAAPSEKARATVNESPEAVTFSWECSTTPVPMTGFKNTAKITLDSTKLTQAQLEAVETALYGGSDPDADPYLPTPDELMVLLQTPPRFEGTNKAGKNVKTVKFEKRGGKDAA